MQIRKHFRTLGSTSAWDHQTQWPMCLAPTYYWERSPHSPVPPSLLGPHSLAEITGTAGHEGQRADIGMAGVKGGSQQRLTAVIHTLGCGPGARAGGWQGHTQPSDFTNPTQHSSLGRRERKRSVERRRKGCGHQQTWSPVASDFLRTRQETNLSQTLGWG